MVEQEKNEKKYVNKNAYLEILERIRMPLFNIKSHLTDNKSYSAEVDKNLDALESFLQEMGSSKEWEITEDTDVWRI